MRIQGSGNFPEYRRPVAGDEDDNAIISSAIKDAIAYIEDELAPERVLATNMYHGKPLGNEVAGRSQARMTEVRDGILGALPGILRVIHGPEHTVEFVPKRGDAVPAAEQATDYARYIYEEDNKGLLVTHSVLKDGLLKKIGVVKWGMDESAERRTDRYAGLTQEDLFLLASEEGAEMKIVSEQGGMYVAEVTRQVPSGRIWVKAVPPDDFFWNREARDKDEALLIGHRERLTKSQLLALGVSESDIEEYGGATPESTREEDARRQVTATGFQEDPEMGDSNRRHIYCEVFFRMADGLRKICTLGNGYAVIKNVPVGSVPFAVWSPDPEPHAMLGGSYYDRLKDLEVINSALLRGFFDALSVSLFPRPVYVDGQVSVADILNTGINTPIRARMPGMVSFEVIPFTGDKVLPALQMTREMVERRTGNKDGAMSMDMDALQSTDKGAVDAALLSAQAQPEMLARLFAEMVMKPMYRGILELASLPQSKARIIRLRGQYVEVNPVTWDRDMDVAVNVAIGSTNTDRKVAILEKVVADQTAVLEMMGQDNPVVNLPMLFNAKRQILRLMGIKDAENYYIPLPPDWKPEPPAPPQPTPDELWIQAEKEMAHAKAMKELAIKQDELALAIQKQEHEEKVAEAQLAIDREATHNGPHNAEIERYKAELDAQNRAEEIASKERIAAANIAFEREKLMLELEMDRYKADVTAQTAMQASETSASTTRETARLSLESKTQVGMAKGAAMQKPTQVVVEQPDLKELAQAITDLKQTPPVVNVPAPVVNVTTPEPKKRKARKAKITGPDGQVFTIETNEE